MAAGEHGRAHVKRSLGTASGVSSLPGWIQLLVAIAAAAALCLIARLAGVPGHWTPLVFCGGLGLMTAFIAGAPGRDDR